MSVRVNLLPREFEERDRQRRMIALAALGVVVFAALLLVLFLARQGAVEDAIAERDAAQAAVNQAQAEVNALAGFQALLDDLQSGDLLVATALDEEMAVARVLNDVALTLPTTSSLTALTLDRNDVVEGQPGEVELGGEVATLLLSGYSIERYAPGVEGVLLQFREVTGLTISYLNAASLADISDVGVTSFDASGFLDEEILTARYIDGLPEAPR